jgi:PIN domain nuclease of toxin-antitoxin system
VNLLLDTCTFLWLITDPTQLSVDAIRLLADPANDAWLSAVSGWEIAVKYGKGQLRLSQPPHRLIPAQRVAHGIHRAALLEKEALYIVNLPPIHKDPFDRLLVCQAIVRDLVILTPDQLIQRYPVKTAW